MARSVVQDDLRVYLRQISRVPLLSAQQERELGWRMINDGDRSARDRLILANLRLVVSIASRQVGGGGSLSDLIEEGNLGLIRAAQRYDPARGVRFSSYAVCWIRRMVRRAVTSGSGLVTVPAPVRALGATMNRTAARIRTAEGRPPTLEELSDAMGVPVPQLEMARSSAVAAHAGGRSGHRAADPTDWISDLRSDRPEAHAVREEACEAALRFIEARAPREARVLRLRLGLEGRPPLSFRRIGREIGLTGERARQLGTSGLRRLRQALDGADAGLPRTTTVGPAD